MPKPLTATMVACIDDALQAGGQLVRFQGGFWAGRATARDQNGIPRPHHGGSTVNAIVARGWATFTAWQQGRRGPFPILLQLAPKASRSGTAHANGALCPECGYVNDMPFECLRAEWQQLDCGNCGESLEVRAIATGDTSQGEFEIRTRGRMADHG